MKSDLCFIKRFERNVASTIRRFNLLNKKDKVLVAVSGGKDSTSLLYILKKMGYDVEALTIDAKIGCYSETNLKNIRQFCKSIGVRLNVVSFREAFGGSLCYIKDVLKNKGVNLKSCTVCGVLRRHIINISAKRLKAGKVATGHNMDDEAQSIMLNFLKGYVEKCSYLGPFVGSTKSKHFVPRIKPFYLTKEKDIIKYAKIMGFPVKFGACPCSESSFRHSIRSLFRKYEIHNPCFKENIISTFLELLPELKERYNNKNIQQCNNCKEPSSQYICRACQIIGMAR